MLCDPRRLLPVRVGLHPCRRNYRPVGGAVNTGRTSGANFGWGSNRLQQSCPGREEQIRVCREAWSASPEGSTRPAMEPDQDPLLADGIHRRDLHAAVLVSIVSVAWALGAGGAAMVVGLRDASTV